MIKAAKWIVAALAAAAFVSLTYAQDSANRKEMK